MLPSALLVAIVACAAPADGPEAALPALNRAVVDYAKARLGEAVGRGECTDLPVGAIKAAGARRYPVDPGGDYVWGTPVPSFDRALPGDILQFRDAVLEGRRELPDGRVITYRYRYPHHTAIVAEVGRGGRVVAVLHQNVGAADARAEDRAKVQWTLLQPRTLRKGGRIWIYRPAPPDDGPGEPTGDTDR